MNFGHYCYRFAVACLLGILWGNVVGLLWMVALLAAYGGVPQALERLGPGGAVGVFYGLMASLIASTIGGAVASFCIGTGKGKRQRPPTLKAGAYGAGLATLIAIAFGLLIGALATDPMVGLWIALGSCIPAGVAGGLQGWWVARTRLVPTPRSPDE